MDCECTSLVDGQPSSLDGAGAADGKKNSVHKVHSFYDPPQIGTWTMNRHGDGGYYALQEKNEKEKSQAKKWILC